MMMNNNSSMMLKVPFFKQTTSLNCGPVALKMVLSYFEDTIDLKTLENEIKKGKGKGIFTIQLVVVAAKHGHQVEIHSKEEGFNKENMKKDYYKKFADPNFEKEFDKWNELAKSLGVGFYKGGLKLEKLLSKLDNKGVPIVLVDWNVIKNIKGKGYKGHFVPLVGYDEKNVYVHNSSIKSFGAFMKISRKVFNRARKADGTDEDIIIIYKK